MIYVDIPQFNTRDAIAALEQIASASTKDYSVKGYTKIIDGHLHFAIEDAHSKTRRFCWFHTNYNHRSNYAYYNLAENTEEYVHELLRQPHSFKDSKEFRDLASVNFVHIREGMHKLQESYRTSLAALKNLWYLARALDKLEQAIIERLEEPRETANIADSLVTNLESRVNEPGCFGLSRAAKTAKKARRYFTEKKYRGNQIVQDAKLGNTDKVIRALRQMGSSRLEKEYLGIALVKAMGKGHSKTAKTILTSKKRNYIRSLELFTASCLTADTGCDPEVRRKVLQHPTYLKQVIHLKLFDMITLKHALTAVSRENLHSVLKNLLKHAKTFQLEDLEQIIMHIDNLMDNPFGESDDKTLEMLRNALRELQRDIEVKREKAIRERSY